MEREWLTTGQAAQLCSVNADTVLKWIKKRRLAASRTAGGHYRIQRQDLATLFPILNAAQNFGATRPKACERPLRCWEYLSQSGEVSEACRKCLIYQLRTSWCFRTAQVGCDVGQLVNASHAVCQDCAYYRRVNGKPTRVLVVTADEGFAEILRQGRKVGLELRFAKTGYEASASIGAVPPSFVVVDEQIFATGQGDLLNSLASDARAPGLRIILAAAKARGSRVSVPGGKAIVDVLEKPFGVARIAEVINRFPVEQIQK